MCADASRAAGYQRGGKVQNARQHHHSDGVELRFAQGQEADGEDAEKHPVRFRQRDGGAFAPEGSH